MLMIFWWTAWGKNFLSLTANHFVEGSQLQLQTTTITGKVKQTLKLTKNLREMPHFIAYSAYTSIMRTLNLQWFKVEKIISHLPSKYSAQAIFDHNFLWKKVRTILDKIWKLSWINVKLFNLLFIWITRVKSCLHERSFFETVLDSPNGCACLGFLGQWLYLPWLGQCNEALSTTRWQYQSQV